MSISRLVRSGFTILNRRTEITGTTQLSVMLAGLPPLFGLYAGIIPLALALLWGLLVFLFWLFRLAFLANFLSLAVLADFITGLGWLVWCEDVFCHAPMSVKLNKICGSFAG